MKRTQYISNETKQTVELCLRVYWITGKLRLIFLPYCFLKHSAASVFHVLIWIFASSQSGLCGLLHLFDKASSWTS